MIWDNRIKGLIVLFAGALLLTPLAAQDVQVTAADPSAAAQGTINLNVKISGKGFKPGAQSHFYVTGTANPGGVKVNSTAYVSPTQLVANIDVADTAILANYDIEVALLSGRTGKGIEKFTVLQKGANVCTVGPLPAAFTLVQTLNGLKGDGTPMYTGALGTLIRVRRITLGGRDVLLTPVGSSGASGKLEVFFLDPVSGQVLDGTKIGSASQPQPHITKNIPGSPGTAAIAIGDVNADGTPDIVTGHRSGAAYGYIGSVTNGVLNFSEAIPLTPPESSYGFGFSVAVADVNVAPGDEVAVSSIGSGPSGPAGKVFLYRFNPATSTFSAFQTIVDPLPNRHYDDQFGKNVAIADVTGSADLDLVVGAPYSNIGQATSAGRVFVFPGPSFTSYQTYTTGVKNDGLGWQVAVANVDGGPFADLIVAESGSAAAVYSGLVTGGQSPAFLLTAAPGANGGWANRDIGTGDVNGDGLADVAVGAPNTLCAGAVNAYLTNPATPSQPARFVLEPPAPDPNVARFGWSAEVVPGSRFLLVGEIGRTLGGVNAAGQVYVYKVN